MSKKETIEQAALNVFVTRGLYDAPMAFIAKEAGVPVGSIYTYFESVYSGRFDPLVPILSDPLIPDL